MGKHLHHRPATNPQPAPAHLSGAQRPAQRSPTPSATNPPQPRTPVSHAPKRAGPHTRTSPAATRPQTVDPTSPSVDSGLEDIEGRLPLAVEELLRFCSPVVYMGRQALVDTEIGGQSVRAGDRVVLYYGAANRDPRVFERPAELDLTRDPNPHVAFGAGGPHYCLGSHLARIEIYAILREFLGRCRDLELDGPVERQESSFICGPRVMPVCFRGA